MTWVKQSNDTYYCRFHNVTACVKNFHDYRGWWANICYGGNLMWGGHYTKVSSAKRGIHRKLNDIQFEVKALTLWI